jgi:hypothetical protein
MRIDDTPTSGAEHIPRQLEQSDPRCMQKRCNWMLLVQAGIRREIQNIDSTELAIGGLSDEQLNSVSDIPVRRLPENIEHRMRFS